MPVYAVLTNEQLAQIVQRKVTSKAGLREIEGVGEARIEKYGEAVLEITTKNADLNAEAQRRGDAEENDVSEIFAPWRLPVFALKRG